MPNKLPWRLPDSIAQEGYLWVGAMNDFNPQLRINDGPPIGEIRSAYISRVGVTIHFASHTADMGEEDPDDDLGEVECEISEIYEGDGPHQILFLAMPDVERSHLLGGEGTVVWVWYQDSDGKGWGGGDFGVV